MKIKKGVSWSKTEKGLMIVHPTDDRCIILNFSGEIVWNTIVKYNNCGNYDNIVKEICKKYELSQHEKIKEDIKELLELLQQNDMIEEQ